MRKYLTIKKEPKCIHISKYSTFMLVMKTVQKKPLKTSQNRDITVSIKICTIHQ